jgi:hypothetical protein
MGASLMSTPMVGTSFLTVEKNMSWQPTSIPVPLAWLGLLRCCLGLEMKSQGSRHYQRPWQDRGLQKVDELKCRD